MEKRVSADGPVANAAGRRVISVVGDFGSGAAFKYTFPPERKLEPGRYRFGCRSRGTADRAVQFEVADGSRSLGPGKTIPLSSEWQEHIVDFEINSLTRDDTNLRFVLPREATGRFDLTDTGLQQVD